MIHFKHALIPAAAACLLLCAAPKAAGAQTYTTHYVTTTRTYSTVPVIVDTTEPVYATTPVIVDEGMIGLDVATSRALRAEPGRVERSALSENSVGEPVYVFDIRSGDMSHIVRVSALTGQVLGRDTVSPRSDLYDSIFGQMSRY
jgi:uncharacterized membrane protein YkoI